MKRLILCILCTCLIFPSLALAMSDAYLTDEDLQALKPSYEELVDALAGILIERNLLAEEEREDWTLFQLGDFLQNGGYGTIALLYTPGLLGLADVSIAARRFTAETAAGTVRLETLGRYSESHSTLPGLPLDVELTDADGAVIPCRFKWTSQSGSFLVWSSTPEGSELIDDGHYGEIADMGTTYIGDGRPLYWYSEPADGATEVLTLDLLHETEDRTLATVRLTVLSGDTYWEPEELS